MIKFSWAKSLKILFPFHFKRWLKILIVVWLAGVGIQGFSTNFKAPAKPAQPFTASQKGAMPALPKDMLSQLMGKASQAPAFVSSPTPSSMAQVQKPPQKGVNSFSIAQGADRIAKLGAKAERPEAKAKPVLVALLVSGVIVLGLVFAVFFMWLSSRFNFVLLDMILAQEPAIRGPFRKHGEAGNSYFAWTLAFIGIGLVAFLSAGLLIVLSLGIMKWSSVMGIPLIVLGGLLALAVMVAIVFVGTIMRDFALPIMYREKIPAMSALNKFLKAGTFTFGKTFQYLLVVFGLWLLAIIAQSIVGIFAVIGGVIAGGIVAIPGIILFKALPLLKIPLIILGSLAATALFLAVIVVIGMVMLPVVIFFRVFALAYLTRLYPEYDLLGFTGNKS
ncbi:MAG: hypothetical protein V1673_01395 [Candidatus Omnitrophota bacterium]